MSAMDFNLARMRQLAGDRRPTRPPVPTPPAAAPAVERLVLRPREAAQMLGVAPCTLRRWVKAGELQMFAIGGVRGFRRQDLERFLERHLIKCSPNNGAT